MYLNKRYRAVYYISLTTFLKVGFFKINTFCEIGEKRQNQKGEQNSEILIDLEVLASGASSAIEVDQKAWVKLRDSGPWVVGMASQRNKTFLRIP